MQDLHVVSVGTIDVRSHEVEVNIALKIFDDGDEELCVGC